MPGDRQNLSIARRGKAPLAERRASRNEPLEPDAEGPPASYCFPTGHYDAFVLARSVRLVAADPPAHTHKSRRAPDPYRAIVSPYPAGAQRSRHVVRIRARRKAQQNAIRHRRGACELMLKFCAH